MFQASTGVLECIPCGKVKATAAGFAKVWYFMDEDTITTGFGANIFIKDWRIKSVKIYLTWLKKRDEQIILILK